MLSRILGNNSDPKEIETSELKVRGKTLIFANSVYSIPNLSVVEVGEIKRSLSFIVYIIGLISLWFFLTEKFLNGFVFACIFGFIVHQYLNNKKHGLRLVTNSGEVSVIVSKNLDFLKQVVLVLYNLINSETYHDLNINLDQRQIVEVDHIENSQFVMGNVHGDVVSRV